MRRLCVIVILIASCAAGAAEVIPPVPQAYFNDNAHVVSAQVAQQLNAKLEDFERQTSNQVIVAIYSKMQSDSSIEDYTVRVAQAWGWGKKQRKNGAVLFVFIQDRKMFLQVGYGLEGALPDALTKQILEEDIKPHFPKGDYDGGLAAGVNAIEAAVRGEYRGTGRTVYEQQSQRTQNWTTLVFWGFVALVILLSVFARGRRRGLLYSRGGWSYGPYLGGATFGGGSGGGWTGAGGGFSGGGHASPGGGSFGGGGAGASW